MIQALKSFVVSLLFIFRKKDNPQQIRSEQTVSWYLHTMVLFCRVELQSSLKMAQQASTHNSH